MVLFKLIGYIALCILFITLIHCDKICDEINGVIDCKCVEYQKPHTQMILCKGVEVNQATNLGNIDDAANYTLYALVIQQTNLEAIDETNAFNGVKFENIFIEDNPKLKLISKKAFKQTFVKNLVIRNNLLLNSVNIFELCRALAPKERIELEGNNFTRVPDNAFGKNTALNYIFLQDNNITTIESNAFKELSNLTQIGLNNNRLKSIANFTFSNSSARNISIFLNNNNLDDVSFEGKLIKQDGVNVKLFLEDNSFTSLPSVIFEDFVNGSNNALYFHNNNFNCYNTTMFWVQRYEGNIFDVWCGNLDQSIFRIDKLPNS